MKFGDGTPAELLETCSLAPVTQLSLGLPETQKTPPPAWGRQRGG